ncbi:amidase [Xylaria digitata]|nr:amidase [Xylaria digitata]
MAKIPPEWLLADSIVQEGKSLRKVTGIFFDKLLDSATRDITSLGTEDLIHAMNTSELTAVQVVQAFNKRAAYVHQLTSNMLEINFDIALDRAKELDHHFQAHGALVGPLHGLGTSLGFVGWINTFEGHKGTGKEKRFESETVKELHHLDAPPETNTNIVGYQWNPHNQVVSAGGLSGGEAVMQAMRGSAFGIGTDIGGSVSMPAFYNGIFSLKPSAGRLLVKNTANTDPYVVPIPWKEPLSETPESATFGFVEHDGIVHPHPPVSRAMEIVRQALNNSSYEILARDPLSNKYSDEIHGPIARGDGCPDVWAALQLSGEPPVPEIASLFTSKSPKPPIPLPGYKEVVVKMKTYRFKYQEYWESSASRTQNGLPVKAIVQPVSPYAGVLPWNSANILDFPTIVIPVTVADQELDIKNMDAYDLKAYHGSPVGIQLIGMRLCEEQLLEMARLVTDAIGEYKKAMAA